MTGPRKLFYTSRVDGSADWYMFHDAGRGTDCLVYLHGHGSTGDQLFTRADIKTQLPLIESLGLSVISPNLRGNAWMCRAAVTDLAELLTDCRDKYGFRRYIFVAGSMGGTGALIFAVRHPELVAALGVLGGATNLRRYREFLRGGNKPIHREILDAIETHYREEDYDPHDVSAQAEKLTMPLVFFHGEADEIMPVTEMYDLRDKLNAKPDAFFRAIPGGNHDAPIPEFGKILKRLLEQLG